MATSANTPEDPPPSQPPAPSPPGPPAESPLSIDRKVVRTSPVLWSLGVIFALFLGALGTRALMDIADVFREPVLEEFRGPRVAPLERERQALQQAQNPRDAEIARAERDAADLQRTLTSAEETWRTWLATRATLGPAGKEDQEVRHRRDRLDDLRKERDAAQGFLDGLRQKPDPRAAALAEIDGRIQAASRIAEDEYAAAHRVYTFRVLGARLCLVTPLLLLAAWLYRRHRRSAYLTLLWGYWAFSAWMLLYGIGPYLPHYGGYAPLGIGAAVTIWGSVSLVRWFNRRAPLRRQRIVDRAIAQHRCPGCDRDYLIGRETAIEIGPMRRLVSAKGLRRYEGKALHPRACPGCGMALFGPCPSCHHDQVLSLGRCASCGAGLG
jgi:hypothetical protein